MFHMRFPVQPMARVQLRWLSELILVLGLSFLTCLAASEVESLVGEPQSASGTSSTEADFYAPRQGMAESALGRAPTDLEQYALELINRVRSDPAAEAARLGIDLNEDLDPGTISPDPKPPLAFNELLIIAASDHSQWMHDANTFSHTGSGGSDPGERMEDAGYVFSGSWTWAENLSWRSTSPSMATVQAQLDGLFHSSGHRRNTLNAVVREVGIGLAAGTYVHQGTSYANSTMHTQKYAASGSARFLTGVIFSDTVLADNFYTPGEGHGGVQVSVIAGDGTVIATTTSWPSGGYSLPLAAGTYQIRASGGDLGSGSIVHDFVVMGSINRKLDFDGSSAAALRRIVMNDGSDFTWSLEPATLVVTTDDDAISFEGLSAGGAHILVPTPISQD